MRIVWMIFMAPCTKPYFYWHYLSRTSTWVCWLLRVQEGAAGRPNPSRALQKTQANQNLIKICSSRGKRKRLCSESASDSVHDFWRSRSLRKSFRTPPWWWATSRFFNVNLVWRKSWRHAIFKTCLLPNSSNTAISYERNKTTNSKHVTTNVLDQTTSMLESGHCLHYVIFQLDEKWHTIQIYGDVARNKRCVVLMRRLEQSLLFPAWRRTSTTKRTMVASLSWSVPLWADGGAGRAVIVWWFKSRASKRKEHNKPECANLDVLKLLWWTRRWRSMASDVGQPTRNS